MPVESTPIVEAVSNDDWDALLKQFDDTNYRQLSAYSAAAAARIGARSENVAIRQGGELLGLCNVRTRKLPLLPLGIAYINGAPLMRRQLAPSVDDAAVLSACLHALRHEFVKRRGYVLRVIGVARTDLSREAASRVFGEAGFNPSEAKGHYRTILVDIGHELAEIRRGLDQKWRNILNKAERQELEVIRGTGAEMFKEFAELHRRLVVRKQLDVDMGPEFFLGLQEKLAETDRFVLHLATQAGEVVAGHIGAYHGDTAVYLLGAANEAGLKSNASYLLQWRVIEYAKERGCRWYDLGGIDPEGNPDVYRFKARIGGVDVCAPGPYETGKPLHQAIVSIVENFYRSISSRRRLSRTSWMDRVTQPNQMKKPTL
jgi:CelD/BcsL family acetyltransferase involved in cellulose biosynthesis